MRISQTQKLYELLSDGRPHSTEEIKEVVYGGCYLSMSRAAARVDDLRNGRWRGKECLNIPRAEVLDKSKPKTYWYWIKKS